MRTLSLDLRERIMASYDNKEGSRQEIADRYRVSLGIGQEAVAATQADRTDRSTPPLFGTQTDHRRSSSPPTTVPAEPETGPDLEGAARGRGAQMLPASHPLRLGGVGTNI